MKSGDRNGKIKECDGTILYFKDDKLHREDGPAMITTEGLKAWYRNGELHSYNNEPALTDPDGFRAWYDTGVRHRSDGPAIINSDGSVVFYYLGYYASEEDIFNLKSWRTEVEGLVSGINDAPDMSKYLARDYTEPDDV